jgi:putative holliday junction resolvase
LADFGRILGVDVGGKRVGLARTDLLRTVANPIGTFTPEDSFEQIQQQVLQEGPVIGIVVGWPLTPQGNPTDSTQMVSDYIRHLEKTYPGIPIYRMDERFSSKEAMEAMKQAGVARAKRYQKGRLDQAAAALILQEFLEAHPEL